MVLLELGFADGFCTNPTGSLKQGAAFGASQALFAALYTQQST